jgi:hypothetical protein
VLFPATIVIAGAGVAALILLLVSSWHVDCIVDGQRRNGMDCFASVPSTHDAPARHLGFAPLVAIVTFAFIWLVALAVRALRAPRRG